MFRMYIFQTRTDQICLPVAYVNTKLCSRLFYAPGKLAEAVTFLTSIRVVTGSNFNLETEYSG
jgi:hypothetical protein